MGQGHPTFLIAELSANHHQSLEEAKRLISEAKDSGADAVKIQTYTPDTMTIDCDRSWFQIGKGTIWEGKNLFQLYGEAYTPWDWHESLFAHAREVGIPIFSTPFDESAVDFLESFDPPAYKIASFELVDLALIRKVASTGRPIIISTGMGSFVEIAEAVEAARGAGCEDLVLLKCTSAYPAPASEANLKRIPHMRDAFQVSVGLSDHTMGAEVAVAAVVLGACVVEKHFTQSRDTPGPDSSFSMEPAEFRSMVAQIRRMEAAVGEAKYERTEKEEASLVFRRSLFVVQDIKAGEPFTRENVRSIRPGNGLAPKHLDQVLGRSASEDVPRGTPLTWNLLS